jgi:SAM-dependent methyltransferase
MAIELSRRSECPACADSEPDTIFRLAYSHKHIAQFIDEFYCRRVQQSVLADIPYEIDKCRHCGCLFQAYVLNQDGQAALYGEWVDNQASLLKKQNAKARLFHQYAGQLETIGRLFKQPPHLIEILEFGIGWGYWSRMAKAFGYSAQGLELAPERIEYARQLGVGVIEALPTVGPHYDFIYANQVFEHLEQPLKTLRELVDYLKPEGIVYLRVPDGRGIEKQLRGHGWGGELDAIHPLEHINCFTRKSLIAMAAKAGLKPVQPPLRLDIGRFWGGLKREINDRWLTTHIYFTRK